MVTRRALPACNEQLLQQRSDGHQAQHWAENLGARNLADRINFIQNGWENPVPCGEKENPAEARQQLLQKIVDQVFVYNDMVIAVALYGNFSVVLDTGEDDMPDELATVLKGKGCASLK